MDPANSSSEAPAPEVGGGSSARRAGRRALRGAGLLLALVALYLAGAEVLMRVPVHPDADPDAGSVDVYLVTNGVHVSVWLPTARPERDWSRWLPPEVPARPGGYVDFGWGDRGFYLEVPTWDDLTVGVALRGAFWPTASAVRATAYGGPPIPGDHVSRLSLEPAAYAALVEYVDAAFELDAAGRPVLLDAPGYGATDRFFAGRGVYHLFRTCNTWANGAVRAVGQRAAWWTPFERGARHHLPKNQGLPKNRGASPAGG
jgi:uncharacterized protein (TIGR02117 family)